VCGIVGYIGRDNATPILLEGLRQLEYRGYDSAGLALVSNGASPGLARVDGSRLFVAKEAGRLSELERELNASPPHGFLGIAHTRWATHGAPTRLNAHPHVSCDGRIALVHNGIIENAAVLKERLLEQGHQFRTATDTEVLAHLIEQHYEGELESAVRSALTKVEGTYGLAVIHAAEPDRIVAARMGSPLLIGISPEAQFLASDASAIVGHTRRVVYLEDGEMAVITREGYKTTDLQNTHVGKDVCEISWDVKEIQKGGYAHFMLKEIHEQPESLKNVIRGRLLAAEGTARMGGLNLTEEEIARFNRIVITACGTSWHAALVGEYMLEEGTGIPVEVEYASEFRYRNPIVDERTLVIVISQSGETADTQMAMREARRRGAKALGIINVVGSTIAREADGGIYLHAGPEIGVASTKAFTSQIMTLGLLTLFLGRRTRLSPERGRAIAASMEKLPDQVRTILAREEEIRELAQLYYQATNALYLGRGYNFPVALEGALKLKEISYIHAEGYPAAEMKHGPIALIDENMPVVVLAIRDSVYSKILSNIQEVKARGGRIIAIANDSNGELRGLADHIFTVPQTLDCLTPVLTAIPLQLLAYHIAVLRGCDVDKPRNLAKSVTIE
jgi:glucosamine--fructose-6-phosphate aminotransferase (isomerizing)